MIDQKYYEGLATSILVLNIVSFASLVFVIAIYLLRWKQITSFPMRLSLYLCIASLIQSLCVIVFPPSLVYSQTQKANVNVTIFCIFDSALKTMSDLSSIIWTSLIIYSAYASVLYNAKLQRFQYLYLIAGYIFPISVSIIPVFVSFYGYDVYFCWFASDDQFTQLALKISYFFGPLWIFFGLQAYWSLKTFQQLKRLGLSGRELLFFSRLLLFPLILLVVGLFSSINLIYIYASQYKFVKWLDFLSIISLSSHGLFTSIVCMKLFRLMALILRFSNRFCCYFDAKKYKKALYQEINVNFNTNKEQTNYWLDEA